MNNLKLENYIEHTLLKSEASSNEIKLLIDQAVKHNFFGICINPSHVDFAKKYIGENPLKLVTVIGFPLGANLKSVKAFEAQKAIIDGADELDMVINIGAIKDKDYKRAEKDIEAVVFEAKEKFVKVILETDLLSKDEIITACKISIDAGAKFVKTSTGFVKGGVGATAENIELMYNTVCHYGLQVKASGGIKDKETALRMINAGASRIGTSSGVEIIK